MVTPESTILAVGAHPDDVDLGCGGMLYRSQNAHAFTLTDGGNDKEENDSRLSEAKLSSEILGYFPIFLRIEKTEIADHQRSIIKAIHEQIKYINPDIILTHFENDTHQDHRLTTKMVISATRDFKGTILFYRSPSSRHDFVPNCFIELTAKEWSSKLDALSYFKTQADKTYMSPNALVYSHMHWPELYRGKPGPCEAFMLHRTVLTTDKRTAL